MKASFKSAALLAFASLAFISCAPACARSVSEDARKADIVLSIKDPKSFDIGIGKVVNGKREPIYFRQEKLIGFLRRERQKDLILVCPKRAGLVSDSLKSMLRSVGFRNIIICEQNADEIYAARRRMARKVNEQDQMATYHGLREIEAVGKADQLTLSIGMEVKSPMSRELTQVVADMMFSREELLPFLQQDVNRQFLVITVPKNFPPMEGEELKTFALKSNFPRFEIERARGLFRVSPIP